MTRSTVLRLASSALSRRTSTNPSANHRPRRLSTLQLPVEARRVEGKVAVITGGASGIGEATAREMVRHGATVVVADIQEEAGIRLSQALHPHAHFFRCDVSDENDISGAVEFALRKFGRLNIMFNNAGVAGAEAATPADVDIWEFQSTMAVNVRGALLGVKHAARAMIAGSSGGSIICTASAASVLALRSFPTYTISKHAVVGIVKSAAGDLAPYGIRVNCISPYGLATPLMMNVARTRVADVTEECVVDSMERCTDFRGARFGVDDVAKAALFLGGDESRYVSGQNLVIDGAFSASKEFNPLKAYVANVDR